MALDLFCKAGGASMGLHRAGFDVVGIDIERQPRYPFRFIQADALRPPIDLSVFDFIWASPPCQAFTLGNEAARRAGRVSHPNLIPATRQLLSVARLTCIENVPNAPLRVDLALDGTMFSGLRVIRRRHFELSFPAPFALGFDARHHVSRYCWATARQAAGLSTNSRKARKRLGLPFDDKKAHVAAAMQIDWMTRDELGEAIPPDYAEFIGRAALRYIEARAA